MPRVNEEWDVFSHNDMAHMMPRFDNRPHDPLPTCWCNPSRELEIYIHHAMDGRKPFKLGDSE